LTREEYNRKFSVNRQPDDLVISRLGGGEESQLPVDQFSARVHDQYQESLRHQPSLPSVDPSADDYLEQLFAWGDAFVKMFGVTAEDVDEAERRVEAQYQGDVDRH